MGETEPVVSVACGFPGYLPPLAPATQHPTPPHSLASSSWSVINIFGQWVIRHSTVSLSVSACISLYCKISKETPTRKHSLESVVSTPLADIIAQLRTDPPNLPYVLILRVFKVNFPELTTSPVPGITAGKNGSNIFSNQLRSSIPSDPH